MAKFPIWKYIKILVTESMLLLSFKRVCIGILYFPAILIVIIISVLPE